MTSQVKVPSSIVPIDVNGQQFSRMSTFRRSLIHMDFFIRRKKKREKRRNTVTECDTKELENVLQNIINESGQHVLMSNYGNPDNKGINTDYDAKDKANVTNRLQEKNNNSEKALIEGNVDSHFNSVNLKQKHNSNALTYEDVKLDFDSYKHISESAKQSTMNRRKSKGHIPISTISAAMSVAVEMRQMNGKNTLDSLKKSENSRKNISENPSTNQERGNRESFSEVKNYKRNRLKDTSPESKCYFEASIDQNETPSDDKLSKIHVKNTDRYLNSLEEQEVFIVTSDESDVESPDKTKNNYASLLSLSSLSNESLNSLLSQTAGEITSSNVTLSSIGIEPFQPSIPLHEMPGNKETQKSPEKVNIGEVNESLPETKIDTTKPSKKVKPKKIFKPSRTDKEDISKYSTENSKSIFSSLVNKKPKSKNQNKHKSADICPSNKQSTPIINMYGCSSPKILKQIPTFIKENVSPMTENPRTCMQSFITYEPFQDKVIEQEYNQVTYEHLNTGKTEIRESNSISSPPLNFVASEVPLKYSHKVTVTPISRKCIKKENNWKDESVSDNEEVKKHLLEEKKEEKFNRLHYANGNNHAPTFKSCKYPTLHTGTKQAARVVLDPEGRVIYSTNSLDRKPLTAKVGRHENYYLQTDSESYKGLRPMPSCLLTQIENKNVLLNSTRTTHKDNEFHTDKVTKNSECAKTERYTPRKGHPQADIYSQMHSFCPYPTSLAKNGTEPTSHEFANNPSVYTSFKYANAYFKDNPIPLTHPDPNISGLPSIDEIKNHSTNLHSSNKMTSTSTLSNPSNDLKTEQSNMSMDDLFAVIHNYKKRMNIKSDSDISLESSSSHSNSSFRPASSKGALAETGFLSPKSPSSNFNTSRDRRSWADFRPLSCSTPNNRKSLASDRLGPPKPTSMHDFKMLLLQARSNNQANGPRKSAVEMLRVSTAQDKISNSTPNSPPNSLNPFPILNSPTELCFHNGHTTVPFKRNNRARSSLQSRYTMYPPIFEDCSEDFASEHPRDDFLSCSLKQYAKRDINDSSKHYSDINNDNCTTLVGNSRHWI